MKNGRSASPPNGGGRPPKGPSFTGRMLVVFDEAAVGPGIRSLADNIGVKMASASDFPEGIVDASLAGADGIVFDELGIAVMNAPRDVSPAIASVAGGSHVLAVEPEQLCFASVLSEQLETRQDLPPVGGAGDAQYLIGYRDAVVNLVERLTRSGLRPEPPESEIAALNENVFTWGLQLTGAALSPRTGEGVRLAVLDTGFEFGHPDFAERTIHQASFIPGESAQDGHGHGTHCIGISCGPRRPAALPGYGVAPAAEVYVGKVLSNAGSGADGGILAGINWAVKQRCRVISMSLGAPTQIGDAPSPAYEAAGRRALMRGSLIVAAAGNESHRPGDISPVGRPANSRTIMAVAALDSLLGIAPFSCGGLNGGGGTVDIAGPGVDVYSSFRAPLLHRRLSGTSMATPHIAGIAALYAQAHPELSALELWRKLLQTARALPLPARDVGVGLAQA